MNIRLLQTLAECRQVAELEKSVWGYTDAEDVIGRELTSAVRTNNPAQSDAAASAGVASTPLALVGLAGVTLFVLSAGGLGYVARRRRGLGEPGSGTE